MSPIVPKALTRLGWTPEALARLERLRGWTPEALERLEVGYDVNTQRVVFTVRDETGEAVTTLRYQPDPALRGGAPKVLAERGAERHLFPPPELLGEHEIESWLMLTEGEADTVRLWSLGLAAVAVPGTGKWDDRWAARFAGRHWKVAVCFDCDERGREAARRAAGALARAGVEARVVELDASRADSYDVTDFTASATSPELRREAAAQLRQLAEAAPIFVDVVADDIVSKSDGRVLVRRALAGVTPRRVRWLLPGLIPLRALTLVASIGGLGKSTWLAGVAARVSRGELLDGQPGDVLIVSFEDPAAEVLRPRVEAAEGDLERVHEIIVEGGPGIAPVQLPADADELQRLIDEVQARLLIIDPIVAAFDVELDSYKDQDVRGVLAVLAELAERADCAIALVAHLNKTPSRDAYLRIANSVAFWNAARSVVLITEDDPVEEEDDEAELRLVAQAKANWTRRCPIERYRLEEIVLPDTVDPETGTAIETSRFQFLELAFDVERGDLLGGRTARDDGADMATLVTALLFLADALRDGEWHDSAGLKTIAGAQGISLRTLQRAATELDVEHENRGFPRSTYWRRQSRQAGA
jgi:AAA domain/Toprim-like